MRQRVGLVFAWFWALKRSRLNCPDRLRRPTLSKRFVAFYWTRPVFWAGFRHGFKSITDAYEKSATIRYQVARLEKYKSDVSGQIFDRFAFMEISSHTASKEFADEFKTTVVAAAHRHSAQILFVNFKETDGWRAHQFLDQILADEELCMPVPPCPVGDFDPARHFAMWRARSESEGAKRRELALQELAVAYEHYRHSRGKWVLIRDHLNERKFLSFGGRVWSAANAEKVFNRYIRDARTLPEDQFFNPNDHFISG